MSVWRRLRLSGAALVLGWLAGLIATAPFQVLVAERNSEGVAPLFCQLLLLGMAVWAVWSFFFALLGWLFAAVPLAVLIRPAWLVRHSKWLVAASGLAALAAPSVKFQVWKALLPHEHIDKLNYRLYAVFFTAYAVVMSAVYIRLLWQRRRFEGGERTEGHEDSSDDARPIASQRS